MICINKKWRKNKVSSNSGSIDKWLLDLKKMNILLLKSGNTNAQRIIRRTFFGSKEYKPETSADRRKNYKESVILSFWRNLKSSTDAVFVELAFRWKAVCKF